MPVWIGNFQADWCLEVEGVWVEGHIIKGRQPNAEAAFVVIEHQSYESAMTEYRKFCNWLQRGAHGAYLFGGNRIE